jgi:hypothetical protein
MIVNTLIHHEGVRFCVVANIDPIDDVNVQYLQSTRSIQDTKFLQVERVALKMILENEDQF